MPHWICPNCNTENDSNRNACLCCGFDNISSIKSAPEQERFKEIIINTISEPKYINIEVVDTERKVLYKRCICSMCGTYFISNKKHETMCPDCIEESIYDEILSYSTHKRNLLKLKQKATIISIILSILFFAINITISLLLSEHNLVMQLLNFMGLNTSINIIVNIILSVIILVNTYIEIFYDAKLNQYTAIFVIDTIFGYTIASFFFSNIASIIVSLIVSWIISLLVFIFQ